MIAGTHLCLDLTTYLVFLSKRLTNVLSWYYRFGKKNEKARDCGKVNQCNAIKVFVWCHYRGGSDGPLNKMSPPLSRMRKCLSRNTCKAETVKNRGSMSFELGVCQ